MGRLKAACWQQESDQGPWFSVTLSRSYKDGQGTWQTAHSFGRDDLLVVAKLCDQVHTWIYQEQARLAGANGEQERKPGEDDQEVPY